MVSVYFAPLPPLKLSTPCLQGLTKVEEVFASDGVVRGKKVKGAEIDLVSDC